MGRGRAEAARLNEVRQSDEEEYVEALLMCGRANEAVADARRLVSRAGFREHRWALYALTLYRTGRQREALDVLRHARTTMRKELGLDPGPELADLEAAILRQDPALSEVPADSGQTSDVCPYPGLRAFDSDYAELFSGREAEVTDCLARLDDFGFLVVAESVLSIWDARTHAPIVTGLTLPTTDGDGALAATSGGHLFIGTATGIQRLDLDVEHWKAAACKLAGRPLTKQEWDSYLPGTAYEPACA